MINDSIQFSLAQETNTSHFAQGHMSPPLFGPKRVIVLSDVMLLWVMQVISFRKHVTNYNQTVQAQHKNGKEANPPLELSSG